MSETHCHRVNTARLASPTGAAKRRRPGAPITKVNAATAATSPDTPEVAASNSSGYRQSVHIAGANHRATDQPHDRSSDRTIAVLDHLEGVLNPPTRRSSQRSDSPANPSGVPNPPPAALDMSKPKTITNAQIVGQQGEETVSQLAYRMGFLFSHHGPIDAGIDGFLEIRDPVNGQVTGKFVAVQVKTTSDGPYAGETETGFDYTMRPEDVSYWRGTNVPVIIVLVHLGRRTAYWKSVDAGTGRGARRLRIEKVRDVFDETAADAIASLCVDREGFGIYFPPLNQGETAHLNLLKIHFPPTAYVAFSPYKTGRQALFALLESEDRPPDDWVVRGGQFMSFRDPRAGPLAEIVDGGTVEPIGSEETHVPRRGSRRTHLHRATA